MATCEHRARLRTRRNDPLSVCAHGLLGLCVAASLLACSGDGLSPEGPAWVEMGAGETEFGALGDGDVVQIVAGPQGGYMIALGLRAGGVVPGDPSDPADPDNPRTTFRAADPDTGDVLGIVTQQRGLITVNDETFELVGSWLIFNPTIDTSMYFDREIGLSVSLVDALESDTLDEVSVVVSAP